MIKHLRISLAMTLILTLLTGVVYPATITLLARIIFPARAEGSLLQADGRLVGSEWIGQPFLRPEYFWGRPSATAGQAYNATASGGSNLGPSNPTLRANVAARAAQLRAAHATTQPPPVDLVTASASGLDPHISPASAAYQVARVAAARHVPDEAVRELVRRHVEGRQAGLLGEPRVNVLRLNMALDREWPESSRRVDQR